MTRSLLILGISLLSIIGYAQQDDPVLFSVEGKPVHVSEFNYIYTKTNGKRADFSKRTLEEYLDLYVKFKLKVHRAREMKLDTIPELIRELAGYRNQLADSYLIDKEVTDKLIKEAYERIKEDVDISHILFQVPPNATEADEKAAYDKAVAAKKRIDQGEDFAVVAKAVSDDKSAKTNGGHIGYVTPIFPNGLYELEKAAYIQSVGVVSDPIRSQIGYHLLVVNQKRPARGEVEIAHILIRTEEANPMASKMKIDSIHSLLEAGENFEKLAKTHSDDKRSKANGGHVGFLGINKYQKEFEEAAFALKNDGDFSKPIKSKAGWHILKRISKKDIQPYQIEKSRLEQKITKDARFESAKTAMVEKIKQEANFKEEPQAMQNFIESLSDTFLTFKWQVPKEQSPEILFSLGRDYQVSVGKFTDYLGRASRKRISMGRNGKIKNVVDALYKDFVKEELLRYEEKHLEEKYPDFKALMREYEEGILLFEATKIEVWDKASQDSVGLAEFFKKVDGHYRWKQRARLTTYKMGLENQSMAADIRSYAKNHTPEEVLAKFNTDAKKVISYEQNTYEEGRHLELNQMKWEVGEISQSDNNKTNRTITFVKIEEIIPESSKTLKEARGYVVADYQDSLEKKWVEALRKDYKVKVYRKVFEGLIKE